MAQEDAEPKFGAGHAQAMFRQGLSELRGALYNESNVAQPPQYGLYGTRTPGEVAEARKSEERTLDEEPSGILQERLQQAEKERDRDAEPRGRERE